MLHEKHVRLPSRLVGVVRTDSAAAIPAEGPVAAPPHAANPGPAPAPENRQEREAVERALTNLHEAAQIMRTHHEKLVGDMQQATVALAVAVAARFLDERLEAGAYPVENVVRQAIARLEPRRPVTVTLHPDDVALLRNRLTEEDLAGPDVRIIADTNLHRGDCHAQAGDVRVWVDLEAQLAELRGRLLDSLAENS